MEITLQDLLDELTREGGSLSELLARYTAEGAFTLAEADRLEAEARDAFNTLRNAEGGRTAAEVETLATFADAVDGIRAQRTEIETADAAQAAAVAEIEARIAPVAEAETPAEGDSDETPADGDAETEPADAPADVVVPDDASSIAEPALTASVTPPRRQRIDLASIARRTQRPEPTDGNRSVPFGGSLVAAAGTPGGGSAFNSWLDLGGVAAKMFGSTKPSQLNSLVAAADRSGQDFYQRNGLAEFRLSFPDDLIANGNDDTDVFARAADQSRLPGGSLLAAGGWCSPSETMYDLCELPCSLDGILSIPEVGAPRGGVRWTKGLDFAAIYNGTGYFHFTEAQMMTEPRPEKPCMEIPCVDFDECRLDVDGLCITADIMQSRTYPELVAQFLQGSMCAHAHRVNANKIAQIVAGSTNDGTITMAGLGATNSILYAIELEIQAYRYRGRRAQEGSPALLELVAPYWVKAVIRADIANRNAPSGIGNPQAVTDAEIVQWFATRGVAVQFVYGYQDLVGVVTEPGAPIVDYPNTVEFLLYEAGTWVAPSLDVITLETLYDSTLIKQNKYTALFTEQAFCVINRCHESRRFTVPICANGNTGLQVQAVCA